MNVDISEKNFEATIEAALLAGGPDAAPGDLVAVREAPGDFTPGSYLRRAPEQYDRTLCLIPDDALAFVYATQPKEWDKFKKLHGTDRATGCSSGSPPRSRSAARWTSCGRGSRAMAASSSSPTSARPAG